MEVAQAVLLVGMKNSAISVTRIVIFKNIFDVVYLSTRCKVKIITINFFCWVVVIILTWNIFIFLGND